MTDKTEHRDIYAAMLAAQPRFSKPAKKAENKHFGNKYADLDAVCDAVRPALNSNGIVFFHMPVSSELGESIVTVLYHSASDTKMEFPVPLFLAKRDSQGYKAASTYAKRIGLEDATGVAPSDDDDANASTDAGASVFGAGLKDAWRQGVLDKLPESATPAEKAAAFKDAIIADFDGKGEKALGNAWKRHESLTESMRERFPEYFNEVYTAFERAEEAIAARSANPE